MNANSLSRPPAAFDSAIPAVVITAMTVTDRDVVAGARSWATLPASDAPDGDLGDVTGYVEQALLVGARAIAAAGAARQELDVRTLLTEVETRMSLTGAAAAAQAGGAAAAAATSVAQAADTARAAILASGDEARKGFTVQVDAAAKTLGDQVQRLVGGENPELMLRLQPVLDRFGQDLQERGSRQTRDLVDRVAKQFDVNDPSSPLAVHGRQLSEQQRLAHEALVAGQKEITGKLAELSQAVRTDQAAKDAASAVLRVTPLKGAGFADAAHQILRTLAAGLGDEYIDCSAEAGLLPRCKKGDGVLAVAAGDVRVVVEMTDSTRAGWSDYLDEAERNRGARGGLGLVRSPTQLGGSRLLTLGPRRIVLAFDPDRDDPDLLRAVLHLLRLSAQAAARQSDDGELEVVADKISAALDALARIGAIRTAADGIRKSALKVDNEAVALETTLTTLLTAAQGVLSDAAASLDRSAA